MKNVPEKYAQGQSWIDANYISVVEVQERFNVSRQQQRNLYMKGIPPDAFYIGSTLSYFRPSAEAFFSEYDAKQKARIKNANERKEKRKPGRPKKDKESWRTFTLYGKEQRIPNEYRNVHEYWRREQVAGLKYLNETGQTGQITEDSKAFSQYLKDLQKALGIT